MTIIRSLPTYVCGRHIVATHEFHLALEHLEMEPVSESETQANCLCGLQAAAHIGTF